MRYLPLYTWNIHRRTVAENHNTMSANLDVKLAKLEVYDVRFPTSLTLAGSDAVHHSPDYSTAYVIIKVDGSDVEGHGFTFTIGRGTEIVVKAIESYRFLVEGLTLKEIVNDFGTYCRKLTNDSQLRWLGPEKGVVHLACAAILNAIWDLWAKLEKMPVWKLLCSLTPEELVRLVDFRYLSDALTQAEALQLLQENLPTKSTRTTEMCEKGIPSYITSAGWIGYSNEKIKALCREGIENGWNDFKMKVGVDMEQDSKRARLIRGVIGYQRNLMMDANQVWEVDEAIKWMTKLAEFKPLWIEEPTSPDDVEGHLKVSQALCGYDIGVATGEHCQNRIVFKQLLTRRAIQFCQIDACRVGGINELLAVLLLAAKYNVPVCPHAGGVGLCELVTHIAAFNYIAVAPTLTNTMVEFADHLHEHFVEPARVANGKYMLPQRPGYAEMKRESIQAYSYPNGVRWQQIRAEQKQQ